jgi:hypothetical protein
MLMAQTECVPFAINVHGQLMEDFLKLFGNVVGWLILSASRYGYLTSLASDQLQKICILE